MSNQPPRFVGTGWAVLRQAEARMVEYRAHAPDMRGAVAAALGDALGGAPLPCAVAAAGYAIADAVADHGASFAPGPEPAYHNQHHQAEATRAMGWLCASSRELGLLTPESAAIGVLGMAGHDLRHDGSWPRPGVLEARSAALTAALAAQAGLDATAQAVIHRVILATNPEQSEADRAADDLLCRLGHEADVFGSLTPGLGWQLGLLLAREVHVAGHQPAPPFDSFAGRLRLLRAQPPATEAARKLGLEIAVRDQIAAIAAFGAGSAERGAARLDALPLPQARADYVATLAALEAR